MTLSLLAGAVATVFDLAIGTTLLHFGTPTRVAAMVGTTFGCTLAFFLNRYVAFRENKPKVLKSAIRYTLLMAVSIAIHGQVVVLLRDSSGIPYVPAKMIADLCVFTFAQLVVLRYFVFPKAVSADS